MIRLLLIIAAVLFNPALVYAAFPVVAGTQTSTDDGGDTSVVATLPASVAAGELLVCAVVQSSGTATVTWPAGWNEITDNNRTGTALSVGYKIAAGGETSVTVTSNVGSASSHICYRINTWHGTTPPEALDAENSSTHPDPPSVTASWGSADNMWLVFAGEQVDAASVAPTNYTNLLTASGSSAKASSARRENATDTENPGTFTNNSSQNWIAATVVIRPAVVAVKRKSQTIVIQ